MLACGYFHQPTSSTPFIAFIPRTTGANFDEDMRRGALPIAHQLGYRIYWNAPTREDDLDRQIDITEAAVRRGAKALIIGPTNSRGITTLLDGLLARKIPVVIVQTEAPIPTGPYLTSVTPNQKEFGRIAAKRIEAVTGGVGQVAIVGLDPGTPETLIRAKSFIQAIAAAPKIEIVAQLPGSVQTLEAEQSTREIVNSFPHLRAIFAVNADATQGAMLALQDLDPQHSISLVGSDRDWFLEQNLSNGKLDSLVTADPNKIGELAMRAAAAGAAGHPLPPPQQVGAFLLIRKDVEQANIH
ncbi:MAG TPA: substrate-binding domain-containing protein [Terracidiphilus sp.]|nr:substrate-binding domain-containing protein [Terracidiphilus sp.]